MNQEAVHLPLWQLLEQLGQNLRQGLATVFSSKTSFGCHGFAPA
jgi:hypothetical protein